MEQQKAYTEGSATKMIERQTSKIPSTVFLAAAVAAMGVSAVLKACRHNHTALFVGQWAAPFLLLGIYNKIVKTEGHSMNEKPKS
ncbi:MAG: hypothetical protein QM743_04645 [Chitinophagaceae bacterium]|uniref:Uncharacterized protein n=1 Tax=Rurimicrobium arvi TaxID=2049916 RepID=A0ABP8MG00_9BACT